MITLDGLLQNFPYQRPRNTQAAALQLIAESDNGVLLEIPTGEGKTGIGLATLNAHSAQSEGPLYYVTPSKTQVEQVERVAGNRRVLKVLGRSEYSCLYYEERGVSGVTAQQSPCYTLKCNHRVDQDTGRTEEEGATPCPYFQAKHEALTQTVNGAIIVCTTAFFLTNRLLVSGWMKQKPVRVVIDEVHRLSKTARSIFEYTMTDFHLARAADMVELLDREQAEIIRRFRNQFMSIARRREAQAPALLKDEDIDKLVGILEELKPHELLERLAEAVADGSLDPVAQKEELKVVENLGRNIPRFITSLRYSLEEGEHRPLNYVVAFYYQKEDPEFTETNRRARYFLTIRSYYVVPLIRKALGKNIVAYSATIGDPEIVRFETGITLPFKSFPSSFPSKRTGIYIPCDALNLAQNARSRQDLNRTLRKIVAGCQQFAANGQRSLVVVVSEEERQKFLEFAAEARLDVVSYNNDVTARQAAASFKEGNGQVLVGTTAQYGEGVDLPRGVAPVIFFLRPGYQRPDDPETQFERRRFSEGRCWALWNWRVMIEALQVRGRNIRTDHDLGVCFFMSSQFKRFLYGALPEWLRPAYRSDLSFEAAIGDAERLLLK